jgi:sigma-B regulation protein RsbU (phosphoserine phosphatase)
VVIGYALGDETAAAVHRQTGTTVAVQLAGEVIAMAPGDGRGSLTSALAAKIPSGTTAPVEISLATGRHLALAGSFPGYAGGQPMRVLLLRSLDEALGPARTVIRYLFALLAAAVLASLLLSLALARRLALPIDRLVALTRQVGSGELSSRVRPEGPREIRTLGLAMNRMLDQVEEFRGKLAARERVEREMEIAVSIQTAILPREIVAPGFEIAAAMRPATEVGGDYYDVVPVEGGCWLGIGDVAGHGLQAGVVMMMAQSAVGALARCIPPPLPSEALRAANGLLVENVRRRSGRHEHVTLSLLRCYSDGRVVFAGAHEDIAIWRARSQRVEIIKTGGAWMGIRDQAQIVEDEFRLELGDLMLLHTDGATEAMNSRGDQFGLERLVEAFEAVRERPCKEIRDHLLEKIAGWTHEQHDDVTVLVLRCVSHQA